jgi:hypothetical protein
MRRPKGHIRQRSPGAWELRYGLSTDPATGAPDRHPTLSGDRKAAERVPRDSRVPSVNPHASIGASATWLQERDPQTLLARTSFARRG